MASSGRIMNSELERALKETAMACCKASHHLSQRAKQNYEKLESG
jgi:hypothetical protein